MTVDRRVLVVDSDLDCRELVRDTLVADGCSVRAAETGDTALALLQQEPVDIMFISASLPDASGLALLDAVRGLAEPPEVIVISAWETIDSAVKALKRGALCYLTKPLDPDRVLRLTRKVVEEIRRRRL